ncbi:flagellar export protein FliJ [Legionella spiritensis]|uniref:Flagellar FliJ protein n=1 Tax=Legionella spiritensis TaxID=452 RepID=A0A0W0Z9K7_LEGSP|nr:flagellar export protein FliJ [Legionella spiritensis]KTD65783.1 flagellar protein FliJ [Legionella spiritensis]SNV41362.1 flagellar FliJ protein [Legionella spiritensis]
MINQRIDRLNQLLAIKENSTQQASGHWTMVRNQFAQGKAKLDQLLDYRQEYMQQLQTLGNKGCGVDRIRNRIEFIAQLDVAISQLTQHLAQLAKRRSECEKTFLRAKADQDVVKRLIERAKLQQSDRLARIEQKESDEYAQKQWYSKNSATKNKKRSD